MRPSRQGNIICTSLGVGEGDPSGTGYSDYGSLGQYFIGGTFAPTTDDYVSIAATDAHHVEGDSGSMPHTFTVTRSGNTGQATTVDYHVTGSGTNAADATDLWNGTLPSGTLSFAAGETSKTITIQVAGDDLVESDETYSVVLSNASGSTIIGTSSAMGTILNDDVPIIPDNPGITVTPVSGLATSEKGASATFSVVLESRPDADVIVSLLSLDTTEGRLGTNTLVFTAANWDRAQNVTVFGVDDNVRDGNVDYTVQVTAESTDANYQSH